VCFVLNGKGTVPIHAADFPAAYFERYSGGNNLLDATGIDKIHPPGYVQSEDGYAQSIPVYVQNKTIHGGIYYQTALPQLHPAGA
jgi:hypothetical protein